MSSSLRAADAVFTKILTVALPGSDAALGFYDFQQSLTRNFANPLLPLAYAGTPALNGSGVEIDYTNYLTTGISHPAGFTWMAVAKARAPHADNSILISSGNTPDYGPSLLTTNDLVGTNIYSVQSREPGPLYPRFTEATTAFTAGDYHVLFVRLSGIGAAETLSSIIYDDSGTAKIASRTGTFGQNTGAVRFGSQTAIVNGEMYNARKLELVCAGLWSRALTNGECASVRDFVQARYPLLSIH